jgi:hypothetical protein
LGKRSITGQSFDRHLTLLPVILNSFNHGVAESAQFTVITQLDIGQSDKVALFRIGMVDNKGINGF